MLKPLAGAGPLKKLKVVSATLVSERGADGKEWVCHPKQGKTFHLIYLGGVLQASNVVEREYDLELNSKPVATREDMVENLFGFNKKDRQQTTFKDIIDLMGWDVDEEQYFD